MSEIGADFSELDNFMAKFMRFMPRFKRYHQGTIKDLAEMMYVEVRKNASGRPGPNIISGQYISSIKKTDTRVYTSSPYGPRLEYGFTGTDSLGRNYHQPPFPHWRPAAARVRKDFGPRVKRSVIKVWKES
jgi:hypothetical protein